MKPDRNTIKIRYMLMVLPSLKKRFQKMNNDENITAWERFEEMLNVYEKNKKILVDNVNV